MMKRVLLGFLLIIFIINTACAGDFGVEIIPRADIVIFGLDRENPAIFDFVIDNNLSAERYEIYSLIGSSIEPDGLDYIPLGKSVKEMKVYPQELVREKTGLYLLEYRVRNKDEDILKDKLKVRVVELSEAIELAANDISINDDSVKVIVRNLKKTAIENMEMRITSEFFDIWKNISIEPEKEVSFIVDIDKESIKGVVAGSYVMTGDVENAGNAEGIVNYLESGAVSTDEESFGILSRKNRVIKTNTGNTELSVGIQMERDILTRLFTSYNVEPEKSERQGLFVTYYWTGHIKPGENFVVTTSTNYTFPFLLLLLIIAIIVFLRIYFQRDVILKKRVSHVKTKGGEFALKVRLSIKSKKRLDNVNIIDILPKMTKIYERFGKKPDKIDEKTRKVYWSIPKLNAGEERVFSYIIYSKLNIVGRFELPIARTVYMVDNKRESASSNKTYFMREFGDAGE